ncbi:MAG: 50S ribosomal protein L24 [Phycisphaerales bacterium]|nr:50S ribosomal protein L24 [Phycisphaerales bacterium]
MARHIRKGDQVIVNSGDNKGMTGEVLEILTKSDKVLVKGVNLRTKHIRKTQTSPQGGIITKELPMHLSNVNPIADGKPTRVRFETNKDGSKDRVAVRSGKSLGQIRPAKS